MKAQNLLPQPAPIKQHRQKQHDWEEDPARTEYRARLAERKFRQRMAEVIARQREADQMHAIGYAQHMRMNVEAACKSVGCEFEWLQERSIMGNLKRGQGRSEKRAAVFRILRAHGYTFPEIGLAFQISHSSVVEALRIFPYRLTRTHNGA